MIQDELKKYRDIFAGEIRDHILPYWMKNVLDRDRRDWFGEVDLEGHPIKEADKGCVLITRILWTFSAAARVFEDECYLDLARATYEIVEKQFADRDHRGYFMSVSASGKPVDDIKHTYAQGFVVYALCELHRIDPSDQLLERIRKQYDVLEEKTKDPNCPGYFESFTRQWQRITENRMADHNEPKSMNTHLHMLEAYTALYRVWQDDSVKQRLAEFIDIFLERIVGDDHHFRIFFEEDFSESEKSKGVRSFGHDIEGSWLLAEAAEVLGEVEMTDAVNRTVVQMADAVERVGQDKDGGLFLGSTREGSHVQTNKHWWIQAETLVGFMNAYQITGKPKYWNNVKLAWRFIDQHVIDHEHGEWFAKVNRLGVPFRVQLADDPFPFYRVDRKVDAWKCPYHNGRACLEMMHRIDSQLDQYGGNRNGRYEL